MKIGKPVKKEVFDRSRKGKYAEIYRAVLAADDGLWVPVQFSGGASLERARICVFLNFNRTHRMGIETRREGTTLYIRRKGRKP